MFNSLLSSKISTIKSDINLSIDSLSSKLDKISTLIQIMSSHDSQKEKMIDKLHAELQQHKDGFIFQIIKPLVLDLIYLHDDMGKMIRTYQVKENLNEVLIKSLLNNQESIEEILFKHGFEAYDSEADFFDPKLHYCIESFSTHNIEENKRIKERIKKGFKYEELIIRHECVTIFKYKE